MKLTALKRLRYPRGPDGKEYEAGQEFDVLSERDAKALTLVRAAKPAGDTGVKAGTMNSKPVMEPKSMAQPEPVVSETLPSMTTRKYKRRDMTAES